MPAVPVTGRVLHLMADAGVYQDTAGTTPVTADGQAVALWQDQSGNANHVSQATPGNRPTYKTGIIGGKPVLRFTQSSSHKLATAGPVTLGIGSGDFWFCAVWLSTSQPTNQWPTALSVGAWTPGFYLPFKNSPSGNSGYQVDILLGGGAVFTIGDTVDGVFYLTELLRASGTLKKYHSSGGATPALDATTWPGRTNAVNDAAITVGWDTSGGDYFHGDLAEILFYNRSLSGAERADLEAYLIAKYWTVAPANRCPVLGCVFIGGEEGPFGGDA